MKLGRRLSVLSVVLGLTIGAGCAGVKPMEGSSGTGGTGVGSGNGGSGTGSGGTHPFDGGSVNLPPTVMMTCGNGTLDPGESCDDGNPNGGDGCSKICQIENGWICPNVGQPCSRNVKCGDGVVTSPEACDDGNTMAGDGCSADCKAVESGWQCRVPGRPCIPVCGDGKIEGEEQCDDSGTDNGDGCSGTCQREPGATCPTTSSGDPAPGKCTVAVCGNGLREAGESCDCGTDPANVPADCTGPNGLFNGDGTGCSKTCTKEPTCRTAGKTGACSTTCGNGTIEPGEQCDDGNGTDGDGCSSTCQTESGFSCQTVQKQDFVPCTQDINKGENCLELPIKYRDFKNESVTGGHPDFFYYGAAIPNPITVNSITHGSISFKQRYCVPNSSGPARKNDSTARCWGLAQANLDADGRPAFDSTRPGGTTCDCQFTDWSHNGGTNNIVPGYGDATLPPRPLSGLAYKTPPGNPLGAPWYQGPAPVVTSATTFGQWWADGTYESDGTTAGKHAIGVLELGPVTGGATNLYRFSSAPHSVWGGFYPLDPPTNAFPIYTLTGSAAGPGTVKTMPAPWSEPLLCDIWPYWYSSTSFGAGNGCKATQYVFPPAFGPTIDSDPAVWFGMNPNGGNIANAQGWFHDSWFSVEARYLFAFTDSFQLQFFGDDDTFVFINGVLMIDLGGVHQRLPGKVVVNADGSADIQEGGNIYMACTNPTGQTVCPTIPAGYQVGDIVPCDGSADAIDPVTKVKFNSTCAAGNSTCDCRQRHLTPAQTGLTPPTATGAPANTYEIAVFTRDGHPTESNFQLTLSGFTTNQTQCGPSCGDGVKTGGEECDCGNPGTTPQDPFCNGMNNSDGMYNGCTSQCKYGPFCGDSMVQSDSGEQCDDGANNGVAYSATCGKGCTSNCQTAHCCGDSIPDTDEGEECDLGAANGTKGASCDANCKLLITIDTGN